MKIEFQVLERLFFWMGNSDAARLWEAYWIRGLKMVGIQVYLELSLTGSQMDKQSRPWAEQWKGPH